MLRRLVFRGFELLSRLPGCGFIAWGLVFTPVATKEDPHAKAPL